ncbi:radical SAM protein [Lentisphaerota bacterium ZTH]|nr:radical SAM protein [Lentisphaerota bacterium]WET06202.1 radical SAM protein [Lentisphaerota bacterium ZTH]
MKKKYLFGPVASRRLGISLGIDLVPFKTCSLNCVYCESGATTMLDTERREFVPVDAVISQLDEFLKASPRVDYLTFSGAGEPTLNSGIGKVVDFVKDKYPDYKLCLLTNATLFNDPQVLQEIKRVDLCIPSLDASNAEEFARINRPAQQVDFNKFIDGLTGYCHHTDSEVWLELFIVPGINDSDASIRRFVDIIKSAAPDKVQLNTLDRPGAVDWIKPSTAENTMRFVRALEPFAPVEAVGPFKYKCLALRRKITLGELDHQIIELIGRRPSTVEDMVEAFGLKADTIKERLDALVAAGKINSERSRRGDFYSLPG